MIRRALRATAAIAAALAWIVPGTASALEHIPFTTTADGLIKVTGTIYGEQYPMLIDLGAGVDVVSQRVATRLVSITGKFANLRLTGQRVDLPIGTIFPMSLGDFHIDERTVGVWSGLDGTGIDALISASAFRNVATTFDFRANELLIEDQQTFADRRRFAARIPLFLQDDRGLALDVFARFDFGNGKSGLCILDTGIGGILIDKRFAAALGVNAGDPSLKRVHTALGDGVSATIPSLTLAGASQFAMRNPNVVFEDLVYDCNVGTSFWAGKNFTLDIPDRAMFVPINP